MRGSVTKKGNKWYIVVYLGYEDGKKKNKWFSGYESKREAERDLPNKLQELQAGVRPSKESFNAFLERWIDYKRDHVRLRTVEIYQRTIRLHIAQNIGKLPLQDITPLHVTMFYRQLATQDKPLSNRYISQIHTLLHDSFDRAVKWGLKQRNIIDAVDSPKPVRKKFAVWSLDDAQRFLNADEVKDHRFYVAFLLALATGMRQGEILGLQWKDIDWQNNRLRVERTLTWVNREYSFGPPKSESGERIISLPDDVMSALRRHKAQQNQERLKMIEFYNNRDLVVARINGNIVTQAFVRKKFTDLISKLDMPYIRFHDLRHTHASILLELGEKTKVLQERLGHSDYSTTMDIYTHVSRRLQDSTAALLQEGLFGSK
jgi:integrase